MTLTLPSRLVSSGQFGGAASDNREIGADRDIADPVQEIAIGGEDFRLKNPGVRHDIKAKDVGGTTPIRRSVIA